MPVVQIPETVLTYCGIAVGAWLAWQAGAFILSEIRAARAARRQGRR